MKKAKGEEVLQLVVANWCAPLACVAAREQADTHHGRQRGLAVEEICLALRVGKTVVYRTLQRHYAGEPLVQRHPSVRARMGAAQLQSLSNFMRCNEAYYLDELLQKLRLVHGQTYGTSLICRALKLLGLRHKKVRPVLRLSHGWARDSRCHGVSLLQDQGDAAQLRPTEHHGARLPK